MHCDIRCTAIHQLIYSKLKGRSENVWKTSLLSSHLLIATNKMYLYCISMYWCHTDKSSTLTTLQAAIIGPLRVAKLLITDGNFQHLRHHMQMWPIPGLPRLNLRCSRVLLPSRWHPPAFHFHTFLWRLDWLTDLAVPDNNEYSVEQWTFSLSWITWDFGYKEFMRCHQWNRQWIYNF